MINDYNVIIFILASFSIPYNTRDDNETRRIIFYNRVDDKVVFVFDYSNRFEYWFISKDFNE